ncbi:hypothetical protein J8L86_01175 [Shewanella sp. MMG014]|uniref:hypothetical protein n=1 Tax=Shewanella sp. MMG014 TaxID=2822691 RepID=UPI001B39A353|nr:hypothetical protein [Shewanella sp. MMG014]MBQ4888439.1 hypothetical protein [Shewanella sp. MMG014]
MVHKLTAITLSIYALIAGCLLLFSYADKTIWQQFIYAIVFIVIPIIGTLSSLYGDKGGISLVLLLMASQVIRPLTPFEVFPFHAPFSLAFPFGQIEQGKGYLFDIFAFVMLLVVASMLKPKKR